MMDRKRQCNVWRSYSLLDQCGGSVYSKEEEAMSIDKSS